MREIIRRRALLFIAGLMLMAAAPLAEPVAQKGQAPEKVRIVYLPVFGKSKTLERFKPVTDFLAGKLGRPVTAISFDSYQEMIVYMSSGAFEIAYMSPASYVSASSLIGLEVIAMEKDPSGARGYHSVIICKKDSPIEKLEDARGKVIAFTNQESTSGFMVPLAHFIKDMKTTPSAFAGKVEFAGDHGKVIMGVRSGKYDVGATDDIDLGRATDSYGIAPDEFRVIWKSDMIPGAPVCARADLPAGFKQEVVAALDELGKDEKTMKELGIGGYAPASDKDYDIIRGLEKIGE